MLGRRRHGPCRCLCARTRYPSTLARRQWFHPRFGIPEGGGDHIPLSRYDGGERDGVKPCPFISTNFWICPERGSEKGDKSDGRRISHGPLSQQFILTRSVRCSIVGWPESGQIFLHFFIPTPFHIFSHGFDVKKGDRNVTPGGPLNCQKAADADEDALGGGRGRTDADDGVSATGRTGATPQKI